MTFTDITAQTGLSTVTVSGDVGEPSTQILEVNGTGLGLIDYDNDDDLDLFIANGATLADTEHGPGCRLFQNQLSERGRLRFVDVTESAGIHVTRWTMGVAVADVNGDRFDDLYLTCFGPNILLINQGDGTFVDDTARAGVGDPGWGTTAAFGDLDQDGDLDLYVVNYLEFDPANPPPRDTFKDVAVMGGPHGLTPQPDVLYRNNGDGTFTDITADAGCAPPAVTPSYGLNAVIVDIDGDHRQDIIVGNDSMPNFLFRNVTVHDGAIQESEDQSPEHRDQTPETRGQTTDPTSRLPASGLRPPASAHSLVRFEEIGLMSGVSANGDGMAQATMGMAVGDVNHDGWPDLFSSNFSSDTNTLHVNVEGRFFDDHTTRYGLGMITRPYLGWGSAFADFDHDGDEDLLVVNGHVYPEATMETMGSDYEQPPLLFERVGDRFERVDASIAGPWLAETHRDRGLARGDLDRDGDLDLIITELNGPVRILRNDIAETRGQGTENGRRRPEAGDPKSASALRSPASGVGGWLIVELHDPRPQSQNHRGLGAQLQLLTRDPLTGETARVEGRWITGGEAFQSSHEPIAHFGIPPTIDAAELTLIVSWPDGFEQIVERPAMNQRLIVERRP